MKAELAGTGVEVCTANPGVYGTGFNDRGAETMMRWFNPQTTLSRPELRSPNAIPAPGRGSRAWPGPGPARLRLEVRHNPGARRPQARLRAAIREGRTA